MQVALDVIEADAAQAQGGFLLASRLGNDHDGLGAVEHGAGPSGVLAAEPDVDAAGQVTLGVLGGIANVEDLRACIAHPQDFIELDRVVNLFEIVVQCGALAGVENRVVSEVRGRVGLVGGNETDKFLFRHGLQGVIQSPLIAERRDRVGRKLLPAERAGAVGRVN